MKIIDQAEGKLWTAYNADCCEVVAELPEASIGFSVFSPPFASLYTYSNSERDLGNCKTHAEFFEHFGFLIAHLFRVTMPGRLVSVHCMNFPTLKERDGVIGMRDFRGDIIRAFNAKDFIYHSEVCIWKDPVLQMQRTKSLGLLHKQIVKDSCMSRQGLPDYVCTFRKPGDNPHTVSGELDYFCGDKSTFKSNGRLSIDIWQKYASPVWMDIDQSNVMKNWTAGRETQDERHICPLQLDVIERCLQLWSNEGDVVLSPFMGIGSEGYKAVEMGRKFVGVELKPSYYKQAVENLTAIESQKQSELLFL